MRVKKIDIEKTAIWLHLGHYEFIVITFGLTNAPTIFMTLMNTLFRKHLQKVMLIFMDDIFIYSKMTEKHKEHLRQVFDVMRSNKLYIKWNKCDFFHQTFTTLVI